MPGQSGTVSMSNARTGVTPDPPSIRKDPGREVTVAAVVDDGHHHRDLEAGGDPQRDTHRAAGRDAGKESLFAGEPARHFLGVGLADVFEPVDTPLVIDFWKVGLGPLANA